MCGQFVHTLNIGMRPSVSTQKVHFKPVLPSHLSIIFSVNVQMSSTPHFRPKTIKRSICITAMAMAADQVVNVGKTKRSAITFNEANHANRSSPRLSVSRTSCSCKEVISLSLPSSSSVSENLTFLFPLQSRVILRHNVGIWNSQPTYTRLIALRPSAVLPVSNRNQLSWRCAL